MKKRSPIRKEVFFYYGIFLFAFGMTFPFLLESSITGHAVDETPTVVVYEDGSNWTENATVAWLKNSSLKENLPAQSRIITSLSFEDDAQSKPVNWFLKENPDAEEKSKSEWKWNPIEEEGVLVINLHELTHPEVWNSTPRLRVYSKFIRNLEGTFNLSFMYNQSIVDGECVQIGVEVLNNDHSSHSSYMFNMNGSTVLSSPDFVTSSRKEGRWIRVDARSRFNVEGNKILQFYFVPLCDGGRLEVRNFVYS